MMAAGRFEGSFSLSVFRRCPGSPNPQVMRQLIADCVSSIYSGLKYGISPDGGHHLGENFPRGTPSCWGEITDERVLNANNSTVRHLLSANSGRWECVQRHSWHQTV